MQNMNTYRIPKTKVRMVRDGAGFKVSTPDVAVEALTALLTDDPALESFGVLYTDSSNTVRGATIVGLGGGSVIKLALAQILRPALIFGARGIILGHNHPSGDPLPSRADNAMTARVATACKALDLELLDHVIVTDCGRHYCYSERQPLTLVAD